MKQRRPVRIFVAAAIATAALVGTTQSAIAMGPPRLARSYVTWLSRAMDPCDSGVLTITSPNLPGTGCYASNSPGLSDSSVKMKWGTLAVTKRGKVLLILKGATIGDTVSVKLTLRVAVLAKAKQYTGLKTVTFPDQEVTCPGWTANARGVIVRSTPLSTCLGPVSALAAATGATNIEIVGATVVNDDTGDVLATSGILK